MSEGLFTSLYAEGEPFALIDTRERRDYVNGHWFGSTNLPLSTLWQKLTRIVPDRDFPIHLLDWQDKVSDTAIVQLQNLGYSNVTRYKTKTPDAFGDGFVKGEYVWSKVFGEVVAHTAGLPEITPADYLAQHKTAHLFDVRPTAEYTQFTIPGSRSLPNSLLLANMEQLKQSAEMALLHCAGRTRSIIGACTLKAAGYEGPFAIFKGGTQAWQLDGLEREFNANRVFADESNNVTPARKFVKKWRIGFEEVDNKDLEAFITGNGTSLLFDVSDDAATGQLVDHNIIKVSGTNLIQQTDRSIACYRLPVILFDHGSGSRAAFAAYWLASMGFDVSVTLLKERITNALAEAPPDSKKNTNYKLLSTSQLLDLRETSCRLVDFRPSSEYNEAHLNGSHWANISELIKDQAHASDKIVVIGSSIAHTTNTAELLLSQGWHIAGIYHWNTNSIDQSEILTTTIDSPIDQCALFAGRHHGNMQDSRDYLAWEEALPEQIDQPFIKRWQQLLDRAADQG